MGCSKKVALLTASLLSATAANAAVWHISTTGVDTNDCTVKTSPCKTIMGVHNKSTYIAGEEIRLAQGTYSNTVDSQMLLAKAIVINGGWNATFDKQVTDASKTIIAADNTTNHDIRIMAFNTGHATWNEFSNVTISGVTPASDGGAFHTYSTGAHIRLTNVVFKNNEMDTGGAIEMNISGDELEIIDSVVSGNKANAGNGGAIRLSTGTRLTANRVRFMSNSVTFATGSGGAIYAGSGSKLNVSNCEFDSNTAASGGAIAAVSLGGTFLVESSLFEMNISTGHGGGIYAESSRGRVISSTFFDNRAAQRGGAIAVNASTIDLQYSTLYNNKTTNDPSTAHGLGAGIAAWIGTAATVDMKANIIMGNYNTVTNATQNIWRLKQSSSASDNPKLIDSGYNLIGFGTTGLGSGAGMWEGIAITATPAYVPATPTAITFDMVFPLAATTHTINPTTIATADKIIETTLMDNGGFSSSLKTVAGSPVIDVIPNDVPAVGAGQSPGNPFYSIAQARGAMASFSNYAEGIYFFNIGGIPFSTYVDADGYVLVASSDSVNHQAAGYAQTTALGKRSDKILNSSVMSKFSSSEIDEVRISSASNGTRGTFDAYSKDADVIDSLRLFKTLNNTGTNGTWEFTESSLGFDYLTGASWSGTTLDKEIYNAYNNVNGIHWIPLEAKEALTDPGTNQSSVYDDMDLWVRSSSIADCNGSVATDQRSLPRADYANPDDPNQYGDINNCDIGAFEWNNAYRIDCYDEDGDRPENSLTNASIGYCVSDLSALTPKAILNNVGASNGVTLFLLALMGVVRLSRKRYVTVM